MPPRFLEVAHSVNHFPWPFWKNCCINFFGSVLQKETSANLVKLI